MPGRSVRISSCSKVCSFKSRFRAFSCNHSAKEDQDAFRIVENLKSQVDRCFTVFGMSHTFDKMVVAIDDLTGFLQ